MLKLKDQIKLKDAFRLNQFLPKFAHQFNVELAQQMLIAVIVGSIFIFSLFALFRPVDLEKYQHIVDLSQQENYPLTQDLALMTLEQSQVSRADYLRILRAYHEESARVKTYPAVNENQ